MHESFRVWSDTPQFYRVGGREEEEEREGGREREWEHCPKSLNRKLRLKITHSPLFYLSSFWIIFILALQIEISYNCNSIHFSFCSRRIRNISKFLHNPHHCHLRWLPNTPLAGRILICWTNSILWTFGLFLKLFFYGAPLNYAVVPPVDIGLLDSFRSISMECDHWVIDHH